MKLRELLWVLLSSNTTTSSTALQTFLRFTLMNDAVMSRCQSLVLQLSSASFVLRPVGCVCVRVSPFVGMSDRYTRIPELRAHSRRPSAFPLEYKEMMKRSCKEVWESKAKKRGEGYQLASSSKAPLLLLMAICGLLLITKHQLTDPAHADRSWGCNSDAAASNLALKLWLTTCCHLKLIRQDQN